MCTLGGGLVVRARIQMLPIGPRLLLFGACILPLFFPFVFFRVEECLGRVDILGYVLTERVRDAWGLLFPLFYQAFVITPAMLLASALAVSCHWHGALWIDVTLAAGGFVVGAIFTNVFVVQLAGPIMANATCIMIWVPLVIYGGLTIWMIKRPGYEYLFTSHAPNGEGDSQPENI
jgi:hypothetical protein